MFSDIIGEGRAAVYDVDDSAQERFILSVLLVVVSANCMCLMQQEVSEAVYDETL